MTLLITILAASAVTIVWYCHLDSKMKLGTLCLMYWGASIMWMADAIMEYASEGAAYFTPAPADMLNDFFLGLSVVTLGLIIWIVILLIKDPRGVVRAALHRKKK